MALLCSCGGSSSKSNSSGGQPVTISPSSATVTIGGTAQFTAKVQSTGDSNVIWQVNSITGGSALYGTISGTGLYTAPPAVPSAPAVTITAISVSNSNNTGDAGVIIALPVAVTPAKVSVQAGQTQQFNGTVSFSTNTKVAWQVNGVAGGNSSVGTIDANGLYTAPSAIPSPNPVTVTAVAAADTSKTASSVVTITPPPIVISPATAVLAAGAKQAFTATVLTNAFNPVWSVVNCPSTAPNACGSIDSSGNYTAPAAPPIGGKVTIQASTTNQSAASATVAATIQFGNPSLSGTYVVSIQDDVAHAIPALAGTISFDGSGNISGGAFDSTDQPNPNGPPQSIKGGTYSISTDGQGTATVQLSSGSMSLQLVLASHAHGSFTRTDSGANQAGGTLELQQIPQGFTLNGRYALTASGVTSGSSPARFVEAGSLPFANGAISGGTLDVNSSTAAPVSVSGSSTQPSSGRGTLNISPSGSGAQTFVYYPIDGTRVKLISSDGRNVLGDLFSQPAGPFSSATLKGNYAFSLAGTAVGSYASSETATATGSNNPFGVAGVFSSDGNSTIDDQQFYGIYQSAFDFNAGGYLTDSSSGRTALSWTYNRGTPLRYVAYPRSDGGFVVMEADGVFQGTGVALPQANAAIVNLFTIQGGWALKLAGSSFATPSTAERFTGAGVTSNNNVLTGTVSGTGISQPSAFTLSFLNLDAAHQRYQLGVSSDAASFAGGSMVLYRINDSQAFMVELNSSRTRTGVLQRQY
jgi:hypothetical protein